MTDAERQEMLALRVVILDKLEVLAEQKDREWLVMALGCMAWQLCLQWPNRVLEIWVDHLDWMLDLLNN